MAVLQLIKWLLKQPLDFAISKRNNQQESVNDMAMEVGDFEIVQALFKYNRSKPTLPLTQIGVFSQNKNDNTQVDENKSDSTFKKFSFT